MGCAWCGEFHVFGIGASACTRRASDAYTRESKARDVAESRAREAESTANRNGRTLTYAQALLARAYPHLVRGRLSRQVGGNVLEHLTMHGIEPEQEKR